MKELSLFSGAGGGLLATTHLLGWETVGYVEIDDYCQRVLKARIEDGYLHNAPIFGDIRTFIADGYAESYQGMVDVVTAGFPCQPFSVAGKQRGADDERNMWPATIECIRAVRPRYAFLENVPGLVSSGYFSTILGDLAESGYDARWRMLSAAELGAKHKRDRLWIMAYSEGSRLRGKEAHGLRDMGSRVFIGLSQEDLWATRTELYEPKFCRVHDRVAGDVDRLKALGNGQVPAVVESAWNLLMNDDKAERETG